jgi:hypothetical protein
MKSTDPAKPPPVLRCGDDFNERFGSNSIGKRLRKGLVVALCMFFALPLALWIGGSKLQGVVVLAGIAWIVWQYVQLARFFASRTCPHCGKPIGSGFPSQGVTRGWDGILHLHCQKCGGEARTDLRSYIGHSWPEKVP